MIMSLPRCFEILLFSSAAAAEILARGISPFFQTKTTSSNERSDLLVLALLNNICDIRAGQIIRSLAK